MARVLCEFRRRRYSVPVMNKRQDRQWFIQTGLATAGIISTAASFATQRMLLLVLAIALFLAAIYRTLRVKLRRSPRVWTWYLKAKHGKGGKFGELRGKFLEVLLPFDENTRRAYDSLVWKEDPEDDDHQPLLAPMDSISKRKGWDTWAFATRIHREGVVIETSRSGASGQARKTISINLSDTRLGIYNNSGKRFLDWSYDGRVHRAEEESKLALAAITDFDATKRVRVAYKYPLRWASGGVLPIVSWRGEKWVALFFRDIRPTGWNIANGASESLEEQVEVGRLIHREFCEELMVCTGDPVGGRYVDSHPFAFHGGGMKKDILESREHLEVHRQLRVDHDGVNIGESDVNIAVPVRYMETPWSCEVTLSEGADPVKCPFVIPSVNPHEFGIEMVQVLTFSMDDDHVLLDGEIIETRNFLARRPVAMFRLEKLRDSFKDGLEVATRDRRMLPVFGSRDVHVFKTDIESRLRRKEVTGAHAPTLKESELIEEWLESFGEMFSEEGLTAEPVRLLCPVTWKTLQLAFDHKVI